MNAKGKQILLDVAVAVLAGLIVGFAYYFFQNSNGFAPGGVGGLATITYYLTGYKVSWALLMLAFNIPIFIYKHSNEQNRGPKNQIMTIYTFLSINGP